MNAMMKKQLSHPEKTETMHSPNFPIDAMTYLHKGRVSIQLWDEWLREAEKNLETYMWIIMGISIICFAGIVLSLSL